MPEAASTRTALVQLLKDNGPMTAKELAEKIEMRHQTIASCIYLARKRHGLKYFRVVEWIAYRGQGGMPIPVFTFGTQSPFARDADRPKFDSAERKRRYYDKNKAIINLRKKRKAGIVNPYLQLIR